MTQWIRVRARPAPSHKEVKIHNTAPEAQLASTQNDQGEELDNPLIRLNRTSFGSLWILPLESHAVSPRRST